jgi:adenine-specific DNA-methyltransferase
MAKLASVGMMIWDGSSLGTMLNVLRLVHAGKKAAVYVSPMREFVNVASEDELDDLVSRYAPSIRERLDREVRGEGGHELADRQLHLA